MLYHEVLTEKKSEICSLNFILFKDGNQNVDLK